MTTQTPVLTKPSEIQYEVSSLTICINLLNLKDTPVIQSCPKGYPLVVKAIHQGQSINKSLWPHKLRQAMQGALHW